MRTDVSGKENCPETSDAFSWITPVVLEDGWLDKMDSSVEGEFFPDIAWTDSASDAFFHGASTTPRSLSVVDETPPAKRLTTPPRAKPKSKRAKGDVLRLLEPHAKLQSSHHQVHALSTDHSATFLDDLPAPTNTTTPVAPLSRTSITTSFADAAQSLQPSNPPSSSTKKRSWCGWTWDDQTVFFLAMKSKWNSPAQLPKRWDQLTRKLPHKSVSAIGDFYHAMVSHVHGLLALVHVNLNLDSPDETRLALSCWHRVCSSELDISNPLHRKRLAGRLKHTLFKSRKSSEAAMSAKNSKKAGSSQVQQHSAAATSSIFSMLSSNHAADSTAHAAPTPGVVHTPLVRKKRQLVSPAPSAAPMALTPPPPPHAAPSSATPATDVSAKRQKLSTPPSDARKRQIKVRFVPIDKATQALVTDIGARPKVELSMNGSKRISDVCAHMMTKWAAVEASGAATAIQFRVVPLGDRVHPGWSVNDISVTCLDILHQCPPQPSTDDDTVTLEYRWEVTPTVPSLGELLPAPRDPSSLNHTALAAQSTAANDQGAPTYVNLDFLPLPPQHGNDDDDNEPWHDLRDLSPPLTHTHPSDADAHPHVAMALASTDFNGFLDEGPGACTAWMESFLPPPSSADLSTSHNTAQACSSLQPDRTSTAKKKRITPTLISQPTTAV